VPIVQTNVTKLTIHYPDGSKGRLIYGKCVLTDALRDTPAYTCALGKVGSHWFPADSTVDQWLDETQFDAYVDLGRSVGAAAAASGRS